MGGCLAAVSCRQVVDILVGCLMGGCIVGGSLVGGVLPVILPLFLTVHMHMCWPFTFSNLFIYHARESLAW